MSCQLSIWNCWVLGVILTRFPSFIHRYGGESICASDDGSKFFNRIEQFSLGSGGRITERFVRYFRKGPVGFLDSNSVGQTELKSL